MQSFNGKLKIFNVTAIDSTNPQQWTVEVAFQSADGFLDSNIKANDIVLLNGYSEDNDVWQFCKYNVVSVSNSSTKSHKTLVLQFNDTSTDVYAPSNAEPNDIALIGRLTSDAGFIMLPTVADGVDNANIQKARNIDLSNRDVNFTNYVKQLVKDSIPSDIGGTDDTKLPIAGGTITGNLKVNGSTTVTNFSASTGKNSVDLTANGLTTVIEADTVADKKSVLSSGDIGASVSRVSTSGVSSLTDRVNGSIAKRVEETSASNASTGEVDVKSTSGKGTYVVNTNGVTSEVQINSQSTTGNSKLGITATSESSDSEIDLTAKKVVINGTTSVAGDVTTSGNVTASKLFATDTNTDLADNQLVTKSAMKDYVAKNATSTQVDTSNFVTTGSLESTLSAYEKTDKVQEDVNSAVTLKFATVDADSIADGSTNHFITSAERTKWNAKQDAIDTTIFEQKGNKGVANGYAPLNNDNLVPRKYLDLPDMSAIETPVCIMSSDEFVAAYNYSVDTSKLDAVTYDTNQKDSFGNVVEKTITPSQAGLSGSIRMGAISGSLIMVTDANPNISLSNIVNRPKTTDNDFGYLLNNWRFVYVDTIGPCDCFSDADDYHGEKIGQWPGQQFVYELGLYDSTNRTIVSWSNLKTDTLPQAVKDLVAKVSGSAFVNDNLADKLSGTTTINGIEFDKKGRATGTHSVIDKSALPSDIVYGSGGSSSGGSSLKWLKDDSKGLQVYTDAKDLSGFTRSIKGTNNVSYVVPSGVTVKTMIIKIDNTVFTAGQSEAQTLTFDANGVICGSDTHRFPVFTSYIDENGNATVQHEFEIDQNGTLSTKSIVWNGTMDDKLVGFASGELVLYVRLDF